MSEKTDKIDNPAPKNRVEKEYHFNGQIKSKSPYVGGKRHGAHRVWLADGSKKFESTCWKGRMHGMKAWWRKNGQIDMREMWREGSRYGIQTHWYENGEKYRQETWRGEKKHGLQIFWHENGSKWYEIYYLHNKEYAKIKWDEEGKVIGVKFQPYNPITKPQPNPIAELKKRIKGWIS